MNIIGTLYDGPHYSLNRDQLDYRKKIAIQTNDYSSFVIALTKRTVFNAIHMLDSDLCLELKNDVEQYEGDDFIDKLKNKVSSELEAYLNTCGLYMYVNSIWDDERIQTTISGIKLLDTISMTSTKKQSTEVNRYVYNNSEWIHDGTISRLCINYYKDFCEKYHPNITRKVLTSKVSNMNRSYFNTLNGKNIKTEFGNQYIMKTINETNYEVTGTWKVKTIMNEDKQYNAELFKKELWTKK